MDPPVNPALPPPAFDRPRTALRLCFGQGGEIVTEPLIYRLGILNIATEYLFVTACAIVSDIYVVFRVRG